MPHCIYIPDLIIIQALPGVSLKTTSHLPAWVVRLRLALWRLQQQAKAPLRPLRPSHCAGWMHLRRRYPETPWPWLLLRWDEMDHEKCWKSLATKKMKKVWILTRPPETNRGMYINVFITYLYIIYVCIYIKNKKIYKGLKWGCGCWLLELVDRKFSQITRMKPHLPTKQTRYLDENKQAYIYPHLER